MYRIYHIPEKGKQKGQEWLRTFGTGLPKMRKHSADGGRGAATSDGSTRKSRCRIM